MHSLSTLVLETTLKSCRLVFGNWGIGQHYVIKHCEIPGAEVNSFTIRDRDASNYYLYADRDGIVQLGEKSEDDP